MDQTDLNERSEMPKNRLRTNHRLRLNRQSRPLFTARCRRRLDSNSIRKQCRHWSRWDSTSKTRRKHCKRPITTFTQLWTDCANSNLSRKLANWNRAVNEVDAAAEGAVESKRKKKRGRPTRSLTLSAATTILAGSTSRVDTKRREDR